MSVVNENKIRQSALALLAHSIANKNVVELFQLSRFAEIHGVTYVTPEDYVEGRSSVAIDQVIADYRRLGEQWYSLMSWAQVLVSLEQDEVKRRTMTRNMEFWTEAGPSYQLARAILTQIMNVSLLDVARVRRLRVLERAFREAFPKAAKAERLDIRMKSRLVHTQRAVASHTVPRARVALKSF